MAIPRLELTVNIVSVRVSMPKEELDYMIDFKTSTGPIARFFSGSSTSFHCMLQIECSSSLTTLHQTRGFTWRLDPAQKMKREGDERLGVYAEAAVD